MDYFVEAVDGDDNRHWSDVISSDGTNASVADDAREFMNCELSESFIRENGLKLRFFRIEENPFMTAPAIGFPTDFQLHNWSDGRE